jgi:hypothetical protein
MIEVEGLRMKVPGVWLKIQDKEQSLYFMYPAEQVLETKRIKTVDSRNWKIISTLEMNYH